jgi:hypothetical protein
MKVYRGEDSGNQERRVRMDRIEPIETKAMELRRREVEALERIAAALERAYPWAQTWYGTTKSDSGA